MNARHILVPIDFSEASLEAVKMAAKFVNLYDSTVDLIHVIPLMSYYDESMHHLGVPFDMERDIYPKVLKSANAKLHDVAQEFLPVEHRGEHISMVGRKTSQVITDQANKGKYDLIIMTNKGEHKTDAIRSSITEKVIRYSKVPVLSIDNAFGVEDIHEILVPVDGSDDSAAPLTEAFELAKIFKSKIKLMHIIEPYTLGMEVLPMEMEDNDMVYNSLIKSINEYFERNPDLGFHIERTDTEFEDYLVYEKNRETEAIFFDSLFKKGFSAHTEIYEYANENSDMVVMSTHGRTGIPRVLLGSTTGIVAQHTKKPLLTLRPSK